MTDQPRPPIVASVITTGRKPLPFAHSHHAQALPRLCRKPKTISRTTTISTSG